MGTTSKTLLKSTTAVDIQQMSDIPSRLVVKPKILQSLSACKNYSINLLDSSNHLSDQIHLVFESHDLKGFGHFRSYPPSIITKITLSFPKLLSITTQQWTYNNKYDWTLKKYLNVLHHNRMQKQLQYFSWYIAKILLTSYFVYFGHFWLLPSKILIPTCRNFDVYLHAKNELHS